MMNIDMTLNTQRNNFQWLRVIGVMVVCGWFFMATRANIGLGWWYLSRLYGMMDNHMSLIFFWVIFYEQLISYFRCNFTHETLVILMGCFGYFILVCLRPKTFYIFSSLVVVILETFYRNSIFIFLIPFSAGYFSALFTPPIMTILLFSIFIEILNFLKLPAFGAPFIHFTPQRKKPAASWSSTKRQAGNILAHNTLARPTVFDLVNYSI